MDTDTIKHLDYVQSAISRMADTSFKIKGLAITIPQFGIKEKG